MVVEAAKWTVKAKKKKCIYTTIKWSFWYFNFAVYLPLSNLSV